MPAEPGDGNADPRRALRFPLAAKVAVLIAATVAVTTMLLCTLLFLSSRAALRDRVFSHVDGLAQSKADQVTSLVEQEFERVALVGSRTRLRECLVDVLTGDGDRPERISRMIKILNDARASVDSFCAIDVAGPDGKVVASTDPGRLDTFLSAGDLEQGAAGFHLGSLYELDGRLCYDVTAPLFHPDPADRSRIGVVRATLDANRLDAMLSEYTGLGRTGETVLARPTGDGMWIVGPRRASAGSAGRTPLRVERGDRRAEALWRAAQGARGIMTGRDYRGQRVLAAYRPVPIGGWVLVAKIDVDEAFAPIRTLMAHTVGAVVLALLVGIMTARVFSRRMARRLHRLRVATSRVARGDFAPRVKDASGDELGQLADDFNRMTEALARIKASHDELDREVTERKQAEADLRNVLVELKRSNQDLVQFAYSASHDLHEPLRKVMAFGSLLMTEYGDGLDDEGRRYVQSMQNASQRMRELINDLLTYSRVSTRRKAFVPVDLNAIMEGVLSDLELRIKETGAVLEIAPLPEIAADPGQMRQLLQNLLSNALKFHRVGEPPRVKIYTDTLVSEMGSRGVSGERVALVVEDEGIGFDEKYQERIFGVFQRLHARGKYGGSGIGLAVCRRIAQRHEGTLTARGAPGKGARFTVVLPRRHDAAPVTLQSLG